MVLECGSDELVADERRSPVAWQLYHICDFVAANHGGVVLRRSVSSMVRSEP